MLTMCMTLRLQNTSDSAAPSTSSSEETSCVGIGDLECQTGWSDGHGKPQRTARIDAAYVEGCQYGPSEAVTYKSSSEAHTLRPGAKLNAASLAE